MLYICLIFTHQVLLINWPVHIKYILWICRLYMLKLARVEAYLKGWCQITWTSMLQLHQMQKRIAGELIVRGWILLHLQNISHVWEICIVLLGWKTGSLALWPNCFVEYCPCIFSFQIFGGATHSIPWLYELFSTLCDLWTSSKNLWFHAYGESAFSIREIKMFDFASCNILILCKYMHRYRFNSF